MTTRFKRYSINLDDDSHRRFKAMADHLSVSMSGLLRMMIKDAFETQRKITNLNHGDKNMTL
jgi:predicted transcriptional regulator